MQNATQEEARPWGNRVQTLALIAATIFFVSLWARMITSNDIGYHVAYGSTFLDSFEVVDHNPFLFTNPKDAETDYPPGPGCQYDEVGRYRFVNANWLSQAILAITYQGGGETGVGLLLICCATLLAGIHIVGLKRLRVSQGAISILILILGCVLGGRVSPRPELFGYLILSSQLYIVLSSWGLGKSPRRMAIIALLALQILMVNVHSYFLLGPSLVLAFAAGFLVVAFVGSEKDKHLALARSAGILGIGMVGVCFFNPFGWRLAVLPFETITFLNEHGITGPTNSSLHPWTIIAEFKRPIESLEAITQNPASSLFTLVLVISSIGAFVALWKKKIGFALAIFGFMSVGNTMLRNVVPASLLLIPLSFAVLQRTAKPAKPSGGLFSPKGPFLCGIVIAVSVGFFGLLMSQTMTSWLGVPFQPGLGFSRVDMPVRATEWLNTHHPEGRIWVDFNSSSNIHGFTDPRPSVSTLTNTWAYPPQTMLDVLKVNGTGEFRAKFKEYGVEVVAIQSNGATKGLIRELRRAKDWSLMFFDARHLIFLRNDGVNEDLARELELREETFDLERLEKEIKESNESVREWPYYGQMFRRLRWDNVGISFHRNATGLLPESSVLWCGLGAQLARRGLGHLNRKQRAKGVADLKEARTALVRGLELVDSNPDAEHNLALVNRTLTQIK